MFREQDFALELNLGFPSHYTYLKSIAKFNPLNSLHLVMFYTERLDFCIKRAEIRYKNGGHLVKPEIVTEMYEQTFPLLLSNLKLFNTFRFIDVSNTQVNEVGKNYIPSYLEHHGLSKLIQ